jgi:O-acetyl-ADP-ribose deacetylase (regulator of RNase III)
MPFTIVRQDITKMDVGAIVNAANTDLQMGGGVCGAIFKAAGIRELQDACNKFAPIPTGGAVITPGFALKANYVIHAAGPIYRHWNKEQNESYLRSCYTNSLNLAAESGCESIAFPLISSGIYGYPKDEALIVATDAIREWLDSGELDVFLAVFDNKAFEVSEKLLGEVESYIDEHYVDEHRVRSYELLEMEHKTRIEGNFKFVATSAPLSIYDEAATPAAHELDDIIGNLDEPFSETLLRLIDAKDRTDVDVYKRANIDRKLFSKIRTGNGYMPSKRTAIALAISLELTLDETDDLLEKAGFALSPSQKFDVIVEFFIVNGKYDIYEINEVLFKHDQPLLGA